MTLQYERPAANLGDFFEQGAKRDPKKIAVVCCGESVTYSELSDRANKLCHFLRRHGIGQDSIVGILLEKSLNTYVALLAVIRAGAIWVPLDRSWPAERISFIVKDAKISLILTTSTLVSLTSGSTCETVTIDTLAKELSSCATTNIDNSTQDSANHLDSISHIIYTSGTTGRPKGVAITHRNVCNYVSAVSGVYRYKSDDNVYQGITIAFDFSIDEIWVTFAAGATLVVGPNDGMQYGSGLAKFLTDNKVTILGCVPTLLGTIDREIPSIRLLIVGGERCPQELADRWAHGRRRMLNTYGPTETTVTATFAELASGSPVTIGKPLPTYTVHIVTPDMKPIETGQIGEICIGGPGVALGYLNCPELTAEKFAPDPFSSTSNGSRLYRTGDLGRFDSNGEIEFLGRMDSQVKIRGYRVELGEIESTILREPGVACAAVSTWCPSKGTDIELVAYIVAQAGISLDLSALQGRLRSQLPRYMVPSFLELIDHLPVQAGGKVDRSQLPPPKGPRINAHVAPSGFAPPVTALEKIVAKTWESVLRVECVSVRDDFFLDLGGHSLLAARVVSELRKQKELESLGIADLYEHPTIRSLASFIQENGLTVGSDPPMRSDGTSQGSAKSNSEKRSEHPDRKVWKCGAGQTLAIYLYLAVFAIPFLPFQWTGIKFLSTLSLSGGFGNPVLLLLELISYLVFANLVALALPIVLKWALLGRTKPGRYPLWGSHFLRWWIVDKSESLAQFPLKLISGTPMMPFYLKLAGAKIGPNCDVETSDIFSADLLELGEGTSVGVGTQIYCYQIKSNFIEFERVKIGSHCYVGANSVILPNSSMGDSARLGDQSLLPSGQSISKGESWSGSPAKLDQLSDPLIDNLASQEPESLPIAKKTGLTILHVFGVFGILIVLALAFFPGILMIEDLYLDFGGLWFLLSAPIGGILFVVTLCVLASAVKFLIMHSVKPGIYPAHSFIAFRKWMVDALIILSMSMNEAMYATLYVVPWLRSLGVRIGKRSEVSTISHITPNLLTIGSECFIADLACVGPTPVYNGHVLVAPTRLANRSFLGNSSCLTPNILVPDGCLIGVLSINPKWQEMSVGTSWFGSPPIDLPRRQTSPSFPERLTFSPTKGLVGLRLCVDFFKTILPSTIWIAITGFLIVSMIRLYGEWSYLGALLLFPSLYLFSAIAATTFVVGVKKALIGTYCPLVRPLWSSWVRKSELVTGLYENVAVPMLLDLFLGTPIAPVILRLFGTKIGKRVYMDTSDITDFDLVTVEDDSQVSRFVSLQTHLFEDRVMKVSSLSVGRRCSVGPRSIVLYDSRMEDNSAIGGLSLLMKGETLRSGLEWEGSPAKPVSRMKLSVFSEQNDKFRA